MYLPAFDADLSSTKRLRSVSSLPIGKSGLRLQWPPACVHTPCLLARVLNQNFVLNEGRLPVVPRYIFVLLIIPSLKHPLKFRIDHSIGRTHSRVLVITGMLARDCMNARSNLHVCPLPCSRREVGVAAAVRSG